jgi:hypothetical protein
MNNDHTLDYTHSTVKATGGIHYPKISAVVTKLSCSRDKRLYWTHRFHKNCH